MTAPAQAPRPRRRLNAAADFRRVASEFAVLERRRSASPVFALDPAARRSMAGIANAECSGLHPPFMDTWLIRCQSWVCVQLMPFLALLRSLSNFYSRASTAFARNRGSRLRLASAFSLRLVTVGRGIRASKV